MLAPASIRRRIMAWSQFAVAIMSGVAVWKVAIQGNLEQSINASGLRCLTATTVRPSWLRRYATIETSPRLTARRNGSTQSLLRLRILWTCMIDLIWAMFPCWSSSARSVSRPKARRSSSLKVIGRRCRDSVCLRVPRWMQSLIRASKFLICLARAV